MKSLRAFWHWVDNEKPSELTAMSFAHLSDLADEALDLASDRVAERIGRPHSSVGALRDHWAAIRDLSLSICEALGKMHEAVPEQVDEGDVPVAVPWRKLPWMEPPPGESAFKREYLGEWVSNLREQNERLIGYDLGSQPAQTIVATQQLTTIKGVNLGSPNRYYGRVASTWDEQRRELNVYTCIDREGVDRLRGMSPRFIHVHGEASDYGSGVLAYLHEVIAPMAVDGAVLHLPQ